MFYTNILLTIVQDSQEHCILAAKISTKKKTFRDYIVRNHRSQIRRACSAIKFTFYVEVVILSENVLTFILLHTFIYRHCLML